MKTALLLTIDLLLCVTIFAYPGEKPKYKKIKAQINDQTSKDYYPHLINRYYQSDTSLTLEDYKLLYYGFLFQDSIVRNNFSHHRELLNAIMLKDTFRITDCDSLIKYESLILLDSPFDLRDLINLQCAFEIKEDYVSYQLIGFKVHRIIETILSSGDGIHERSAWHVIAIGHEYDLLNLLGFSFGGVQILTENGCDYLSVRENKYGIKGFYFDINKLLETEADHYRNIIKQ